MWRPIMAMFAVAALVVPAHARPRTYGEGDLATHDTYTNVSGHHVHRPSRSISGLRPAGASARCRDGSWSFSEHHSGTCSHHGGVSEWE